MQTVQIALPFLCSCSLDCTTSIPSPWVVSEIPWYAGHPTPTPLSCRCSAAGGFPHTRSPPAASSTLTHLHYWCVYDKSTENICRWHDLVLHCSTGTEKRDSQSHGLKNSCRDDNGLAFKSFIGNKLLQTFIYKFAVMQDCFATSLSISRCSLSTCI